MKVMNQRAFVIAFLLSSCLGVHAMDGDHLKNNGIPDKKVLERKAKGWQVSPQLRKRPAVNNAQQNNCGYISFKVSLKAPFTAGIDEIIKATKLKGDVTNIDEQYLTLFTFNVPITNELLQRIPKVVGIKGKAQDLTAEDKKLLANYIKDQTSEFIECTRKNAVFMFDLNEVVAEDGSAEAYFVSGSDLGGFKNTLKEIRAELECRYRWGANKQDGIWFDFDEVDKVRPHLKILTPKQAAAAGKKVKSVFNSGKSLLSRSSKSVKMESPIQNSNGDRLSRSSAGERKSMFLSSHRAGSQSSSAGASPSLSPERSPRESAEMPLSKSYGEAHLQNVRSLDATGNPLRIEVEIVETQSGNC